MMASHDDIKQALDAATQGKWEWRSIAKPPDWLPDTHRAVDDLRVQIPTPDKLADFDLWFVMQFMKSGFAMIRNADAELIANAPEWLRELLNENERLQRLVNAGEQLYEAVKAVSEPAPQFHLETQEALLPALALYEITTMPDIEVIGK